MSKTVELPEGVQVFLKSKFTPKVRNEVRTIALKSGKTDVDAEYKAINVFIEKVQQTKEDGQVEELKNDYLMEEVEVEEYMKIVDAVLEIVKNDKGIYKLIGTAFGKVELSDKEKEEIEKKMMDQS